MSRTRGVRPTVAAAAGGTSRASIHLGLVGLLQVQMKILLKYNRRLIVEEPALAQSRLLHEVSRRLLALTGLCLPEEVMLAVLQATGLCGLLLYRPLFRVMKLTCGFNYLATLSSRALAKNDGNITRGLVLAWVLVWAIEYAIETMVLLTTASSVVLYDVLGLMFQMYATGPACFNMLFPCLLPSSPRACSSSTTSTAAASSSSPSSSFSSSSTTSTTRGGGAGATPARADSPTLSTSGGSMMMMMGDDPDGFVLVDSEEWAAVDTAAASKRRLFVAAAGGARRVLMPFAGQGERAAAATSATAAASYRSRSQSGGR